KPAVACSLGSTICVEAARLSSALVPSQTNRFSSTSRVSSAFSVPSQSFNARSAFRSKRSGGALVISTDMRFTDSALLLGPQRIKLQFRFLHWLPIVVDYTVRRHYPAAGQAALL